jgi:hypothetical protein
MSYDCSINYKKNNERVYLPVKHEIIGGTFKLGGNDEAWLNITSNYYASFQKAFQDERGIKILIGMDVKQSLPVLEKAIGLLGDEPPVDDYWAATDGNARRALRNLRNLAELTLDYFPTEEMVWDITY